MKWRWSLRFKNDLGEDYEHEVYKTRKQAEEAASSLDEKNVQIVDMEDTRETGYY